MDIIPKNILVAVPESAPELRGRHSTSPPHGYVSSFRAPTETIAAVDLAIKRLNSGLSRNLFIRLAVRNMATAINKAYDAAIHHAEEVKNVRRSIDTIPTPKGDSV